MVAQGPPAKGGISSFATSIVDDPELRAHFDLDFLNTTRKAEREAGTLTFENARNAIVDSVRVFRAARHADVVHLQTALMPIGPLVRILALSTAARLGGSRVVVHVHSGRVNSGRAEAFDPSSLERRAIGILRVAHEVLTVSDAGAAALSPLVRDTPVRRFDNAVDTARFTPGDRSAGDDAGPAVLLYVGTLSRRKGLQDLTLALELLRNRGVEGWRLEVIGGANEVGDVEAAELKGALAEAGLDGSLLGSLDHDRIAAHLAAADVFVLPSHWEGQPIAVLEAMAAGLPIMGTTVGAMPDVVRTGTDGLLVEPHDVEALAEAIAELVGDPARRRAMGVSARARVEDGFDLRAFRRRVTALYEAHLGARRGPRSLRGGAAR